MNKVMLGIWILQWQKRDKHNSAATALTNLTNCIGRVCLISSFSVEKVTQKIEKGMRVND